MQVRVRNIAPTAPYNLATLMSVFARTASKRGVFEVSQDPILVPTAAYNTAYNAIFPQEQFVRIQDNTITFKQSQARFDYYHFRRKQCKTNG